MSDQGTIKKRAYNSAIRQAAAIETRERILEASEKVLGEIDNVSLFTLEAVAVSAGVTRLTVYNQFGSRRALMEHVFDRIASESGVERLGSVAERSEPEVAIRKFVQAFCRLWSQPAMIRLQEAAGVDPELDRALGERHERRRSILGKLVQAYSPEARRKTRSESVDLIFALTSPEAYRTARATRSAQGACELLVIGAAAILQREVES